jgi:hypothetical protein
VQDVAQITIDNVPMSAYTAAPSTPIDGMASEIINALKPRRERPATGRPVQTLQGAFSMSSIFDMEPAIAELKAIANLIRGLACALEGISCTSDSLRFVCDWLIDLANDLDPKAESMRWLCHRQGRAGPPGDSKQTEAP